MREKLIKLLDNSYTPISNFKVSCIITTKDNHEFSGVNVENISFREGLCAEQNAIAAAVAKGYKKGDFDKLYLMSESDKYITPCFLCRQVLSEMLEEDTEIICMSKTGKDKVFKLKQLCPHGFGEEDIEKSES